MITPEMQRQYQLLKESGARMSFPFLFAGTPEYNDADFNKVFQGARLTPQDIIALTGGDNAGVSAGEWARLSPEVQQAILNDPGTFLRGQFGKTYGASPYDLEQRLGSKYVDASGNAVANDDTAYTDDFGKIRRGEEEVFANPNFGDKQWFADQIAANSLTKAGLDPYQWSSYTTNGANGDMLSVGAEGGIKDYQNLKWVPGVGLVRPNSDYMQVNDQDADIAPAIMLALAGMVAGPAFAGALGGTTGGTYATVADAIAAGDFAAADAMGAAAFDAGGGISGMGSSLGGTGGFGGLTFDGMPMDGMKDWSFLNTGAQTGDELVEGVNAFNYNGQLIPYGEVVSSAAPGFSMNSGLTGFLNSLGIDANGLTGADLAMLGKVGLLGGGFLAGNSTLGGGSTGGGGSSGGGGSYTDAANATAEQNLLNMLIASGLNHPNQSNPFGSSTWMQDPTTGQWTNSTQFSPGQQALYDQSIEGNLMSGMLANQSMLSNYDKIINPIDFSVLPKAPVSPGTTAYDAIMSRLNPQIEADRSSQATALANSGLDIGGKAYSEAMRLSGQRENDLRLQAASAAIPLDETARKNALQEQTLASQLPLSNINALRTGSQPTMPNFGQTWTPANPAQGADLLSALGMQNSYNLGQQNLATATSNANKQGLWGLGTSLLGSDSFWNWLS